MTSYQQERLAEIRARYETWSASADTSRWEAPFLLDLIDEKQRELDHYRAKMANPSLNL